MASSILPWLRVRQLLQRGWRMPGGAIANLLFAAAGAAGVVSVPAAGVFVGAAGAAAVGHGVLSGHAGATARMVRLAHHLKK